MIVAAFVTLGLAAVAFGYRLLRGPSIADRVIALDGLLVAAMSALVVDALRTRSGTYLPVAVVITLIGFISTAAVARFIEGRGGATEGPA